MFTFDKDTTAFGINSTGARERERISAQFGSFSAFLVIVVVVVVIVVVVVLVVVVVVVVVHE